MKRFVSGAMWGFLLSGQIIAAGAPESFPPTKSAFFPATITVDAGKTVGELTPIWRFFGYDEANYTYMKDGRKLLAELGQLGGPQVYIRCHHLLTSGDGAYALKWSSTSAYKEDTNGTPIYDWTIDDKIFDTYLERGLKPYVQLGFMPGSIDDTSAELSASIHR